MEDDDDQTRKSPVPVPPIPDLAGIRGGNPPIPDSAGIGKRERFPPFPESAGTGPESRDLPGPGIAGGPSPAGGTPGSHMIGFPGLGVTVGQMRASESRRAPPEPPGPRASPWGQCPRRAQAQAGATRQVPVYLPSTCPSSPLLSRAQPALRLTPAGALAGGKIRRWRLRPQAPRRATCQVLARTQVEY